MNDDIPFDKSFSLAPDRVQGVAPGVRAIAADNPGPHTFKGTVSYIVGGNRPHAGRYPLDPIRRKTETLVERDVVIHWVTVR